MIVIRENIIVYLMKTKEVVNALKLVATEERRKVNEWFFKTGKGEYGYGDIFLGVTMPNIRRIAKKFSQEISLKELTELIQSPIHEVRLCALIILVNKYKKEDNEKIYQYYMEHLTAINNWDLVDSSAPYIVGDYLYKHPERTTILFDLVQSDNLWIRRISIISTFTFIRNNQFKTTLDLAKLLLKDNHDLIHKAVGWMLREIYKYYVKHLTAINNWDLVDSSAPYIVGDYLYKHPEKSTILFELVRSDNLWIRRISIISTFTFIRNNQFKTTLDLAKLLLKDYHDLIHKAVGWMLREIYKRDGDLIRKFLIQNYAQIPRTTLRYAIERMDKRERKKYLKGDFDVPN